MRRVAIFDFDHTLITKDSFWPFLSYSVGKAQTYAALVEALVYVVKLRLQGDLPEDLRTFVKNHLLRRLLMGKSIDDLKQAAVKVRHWQEINRPIMQNLREHHERGDVIVIASGGLDLYLPEMLYEVPHDALICTEIGIEKGVVTGEMINGNCVRVRKAERVSEWLAANGPFDESWAYGNYPHDVPMMNLVKHRIIVS